MKKLLLILAGAAILAVPTVYAGQRPFPQFGNTPCFGLLPDDRTASNRNEAVRVYYTNWIAQYLVPSTLVAGDFKVNYDGTGATVSEAMGYGMLFTVLMDGVDTNARTRFDGLNRFRKRYPSSINANLMEWKILPDEITRGDDCATDGDLDMATALLLASVQWSNTAYFVEATNLLRHIASALVRTDYSLRLGDWDSAPGKTRSSDFMPAQFRSFYLATGNGLWTHVEQWGYTEYARLQSNYAAGTGLLPDFAITNATGWQPAPAGFLEGPHDGQYYYNACRVPWRIGMAAMYYNDGRARNLITNLMRWAFAAHTNPSNFRAGYKLDGSNIAGNNYDTAAFISPTGVGAMSTTNRLWVNNAFTYSIGRREGYYEDSLSLFALLCMSGNLWLWDTADADQDGLPDAWERSFGGNLTNLAGTADRDGDGATDYQEYVALTDPTNSASFFNIAAVSNLPPLRVYFLSSSNRQYALNWTTNLVDGAWTNVPGAGWRDGVGAPEWTQHTGNVPAGFYRLTVRVP